MQIRPRYGEVDQMGYVYHANYVTYCHQARTELLRKIGLHDSLLESEGIMLPVISFDIRYKKPAHYDEILTITTRVRELPDVRFNFEFQITNSFGELLSTVKSTVVFADSVNRNPVRIPQFVKVAIQEHFYKIKKCI